MTTLEELEKQVGISRDEACDILRNTQAITFNEDFNRACKLCLFSIRALQYKEEDVKLKSQR